MGFPLQFDLTELPVLVVGGGSVAERRVVDLIEAGARVTLVAPEVTDELARLAADGAVELLRREYEPGDIDAARLVFAATDRPAVNRSVAEACREAGIFVNVADRSADGDFSVPARARFGPLTLAIDTSGASPALAARLRRHLEQRLEPGWQRGCEILGRIRPEALDRLPSDRRRALFRELADALPEGASGGDDELVAWMKNAAERADLPEDALDWNSFLEG